MASISVIIPTLNAASTLPAAIASLAGEPYADVTVEDGRSHTIETLVVDGGSVDETCEIAAAHGARVLAAPRGRGSQLAAGAQAARGPWLLFLHADTRLSAGWSAAAAAFTEQPENAGCAAVFRFALDSGDPKARRVERLVAWRNRWLKLPYGDQGLLIHRDLYARAGGHPSVPLMEDVALVRRLGRRRLVFLDASARTSAARYETGGYVMRPMRNLMLLGLYFLGVPPRLLARFYG